MVSTQGPTGGRRDAMEGAVACGAGQGPAQPLIDPEAIERLRQLDPTGQQGVLLRVLQAYDGTLRRQLADVSNGWERGDAERLGRAAHSLKSSSAAVGAMAFAQLCADLEQIVRERKALPDGPLVEALIHEGGRVLRAVGDMLQQQSGAAA